jgi:YVTN family beta-propeller protein
MRRGLRVLAVGAALALTGGGLVAQRRALRQAREDLRRSELREMPGLHPGENLLANGWGVTPAGEHVSTSDMALKMAVSPDGGTLAALHGGFNNTGLTLIDLRTKKVSQFVPLLRAWNGLAFSRDGKRLFVGGGNSATLHAFAFQDGKATLDRSILPAPDAEDTFLAGIAIHPATGRLYVCNEGNHEVWVVNPETLRRETAIAVGPHPHSCAFGADRRHLYVSNWGGGSVSVIDTQAGRRVRDISVGPRPNDMALAPDGRLFVACSGDNTVHVLQTRAVETPEAQASPTRRPPEGVREILATSLYPSSPEGSTPDGVAVSPDGKTLFVANADNNAVMVADISDASVSRVTGFVPVGWYPTAVAVAPDTGALIVADGKGLHSRPNAPPQTPNPVRLHKPPSFDYIGRTLQGAISFVAPPTPSELAAYTEQVRSNSPYTPETLRQAAMQSDSVVPDRVGGACPIKYVLYVIKENRTYDQVFGDFKDAHGRPTGDGNPDLVMYGEAVTPNHHQLARDYVLLDNLYCNGEVSVDGHSWCDAAIATDYNQRRWMMSYSGHGNLPGNPEMEVPTAGYLWDLCRRSGVSFKCYGEGSGRVPTADRGTWPPGRDLKRVDGWIQDLNAAEASGDLPHFAIMSLGEDHTSGTAPGKPTPEASVASNDIALGKIVEAASRSRFWREMAIFVIEDDAQNGPDHVDAHRTAGLVISPWARRGVVDSTFYTTAGMIRTMELILGMPPLTQYDAGATPMFRCFRKRPDLTAYLPQTPRVDVNAINSQKAPGAKESARMDFDEYDKAPEEGLNRILWRAAKGPGVPYPAPLHRALLPAPGRTGG